MIIYWILRFLGHALSIVPAVIETVAILPYGETGGLLDRLRLTASAAVIIGVIALSLLKNILRERIKTPAPWMLACGAFLFTAAARVVSDKLFYITFAWALGTLLALIPYSIAARIRAEAEKRRE